MKNNLIALALTTGILAVLAFLGYGLKKALGPRDLSKENPKRAFESFICKPVPESAVNLKARGVMAFAGGNAIIDFEIDPMDCDDLLKRGGFRPVVKGDWQWVIDFHPDGTSEDIEILRYVRDSETKQAALFVAKDRNRAWFREIQF